MILVLAVSLAAPPEGVDPDDFGKWSAAAKSAIAGPAGCWDVEGDLQSTVTLTSRASYFSRAETFELVVPGRFLGRIEDGRWTSIDHRFPDVPSEQLADEEDAADFQRVLGGSFITDGGFGPMFGTWDGVDILVNGVKPSDEDEEGSSPVMSGSDEAKNFLSQSLEQWRTGSSTADASWRDDLQAVKLVEATAMDASNASDLVERIAIFPGGGPAPMRISARFPRKMSFGSWPVRKHLYDTQAHLTQAQVGERVLPVAESVSTVMTTLGFTFGFEQEVRYRRLTPCE